MPDNSGTSQEKQAPQEKPLLKCGEVGTYAELKKKRAAPEFERDHVPSAAAMLRAAMKDNPGLSVNERACVKRRLKDRALTIAIPKGAHRQHSRTCGGRNTEKQIEDHSKDLDKAAKGDTDKLQENIDAACAEAYKKAAEQARAQDHKGLIDKVVAECTG